MLPIKKQQKTTIVTGHDFKKFFKTKIRIWHKNINRKVETEEEKNDHWDFVTEFVSDRYVYQADINMINNKKGKIFSTLRYLHPLVQKQQAYWIDDNTLLKGYKLKNTNVFRPIFTFKREHQLKVVREDILKFAKIFSSRSRSYFYKKTLLEITLLPEDIINEIVSLTWDIFLLL